MNGYKKSRNTRKVQTKESKHQKNEKRRENKTKKFFVVVLPKIYPNSQCLLDTYKEYKPYTDALAGCVPERVSVSLAVCAPTSDGTGKTGGGGYSNEGHTESNKINRQHDCQCVDAAEQRRRLCDTIRVRFDH